MKADESINQRDRHDVKQRSNPEGLRAMVRAFRHRNFRLYFSGQSISLIGTWVQQIALSWTIYELTHSSFLLGLVSFAGQLPLFIETAFAGVLVDRLNRHRTPLLYFCVTHCRPRHSTLGSAMLLRSCALVCACAAAGFSALHADEGMWLFSNPPLKQLKEKYQFEPTPQWLEHLQKSSVRFNSGGSGSFVSPNGLVITNHHVGADTLQKISDEQHNYLRDGFYAARPADEVRSTDLELNILVSIEDVTARVNGAVKPGMTPDQASVARDAAIAAIEKQSKDKTGFRSDVISLYEGGVYHLYRYKRYDDVRLVFAPEQQIAFYGGDPDNFEYPRYDLDICIFRAYENG